MATLPNTSTSSGRQQESAIVHSGPQPRRSVGQAAGVINVKRQERAIELKVAGWPYSRIAKELGLTRQRIQQIVKPSIQTVAVVKARAGNCCEKCGASIQEGHMHHVRQQIPYNVPENLLYLCNSCHQHEHNGEPFTHLPPGPIRRAASEAFALPYLEHIAERYCVVCGAPKAKQVLCKKCRRKHNAMCDAKSWLSQWKRGNTKTADHGLSQAIWTIRKHGLEPKDFEPRVTPGCGISPVARQGGM